MAENTKRIITKAVSGVGGIKCPCCRGTYTVKEARTLHARIVRRAARITHKLLMKDIERILDDEAERDRSTS